ncbi:MAG: T9SS type A sorting domain-containing protein [Owenweeksia sp.]|nr:T9SS type A sorting domain-containing protein [Owenweeksia sp.]
MSAVKPTLPILLGILLFSKSTQAQFDFSPYVESFDTTGFVSFKDSVLRPREPFDIYKNYTGDELHELILTRQSTDSTLGMDHYHYQEYFRDLKVEGAEYSEHAKDGYLVYANGKLTKFHPLTNIIPGITEPEALAILLAHFQDDMYFAWEDSSWEQQIKTDTKDPTATWYPDGELLWALTDYTGLIWHIPSSKYRLAWRFEIRSLQPFLNKAYYVDARTGDIFMEAELAPDSKPVYRDLPGFYPNPVSNERLFAVFNDPGPRKFRLYTLNGTLIKDFGIRDAVKVYLDLDAVPPGLYLLHIQHGQQASTAKIVIQ